jgi:preprotein translocase subunit YajC
MISGKGQAFFTMSHPLFTILAQASAAAGTPAAGFNPTPIVYMVCIFAIFYFLAIRPQSQRQKQLDAMIKGVKTGDRVITSSGIHGMVSNVKETTVILKIADNVKIELEKSSIGSVVKRDDTEPASAS